jgi:hypothetical protein
MADLCDALPGGGDKGLGIEEAAHPDGEGLQGGRPVVTHAPRHSHLQTIYCIHESPEADQHKWMMYIKTSHKMIRCHQKPNPTRKQSL